MVKKLTVANRESSPKGIIMNKKELAAAAAITAKLTPGEVEVVIDAVTAVVGSSLANGDAVTIAGFGTFEVRHRAARKGRNPQTGAEIDIAASDAPAFKPATGLKRQVAK